jgi:hypothetical protein
VKQGLKALSTLLFPLFTRSFHLRTRLIGPLARACQLEKRAA